MRQRIWLMIAGVLASAVVHAGPARFTPEQLQQDLQAARDFIAVTHPKPDEWVSAQALQQAMHNAETQLRDPKTRDEAWRILARMNPVFADAHLAILQPEWHGQAREFLQSGGAFFPFEVQVDASGQLFVRAELGGAASSYARKRIERINGVAAKQVVDELLSLMHGDTPEFRAQLLSRRFWFFYWKVYGAPARFDLSVEGQVLQREASTAQGQALQLGSDAPFERMFHLKHLGNDTALLTINTFLWPDTEAFYAFTTAAFTRLRDEKVKTLLIDVRENGGGDEIWRQGILRHIADKPFRNASTYIKKVIAGRAGAGEKVGDVVHGSATSWEQPQPDNPIRFKGQVYVLVGGTTYSAATLFANAVQDFGFGKLVGAAGYARARQSGGVQSRTLPNTGLEVVSPRFILDRPSGLREPVLLQPDIVLPDDPFNPQGLVDALLARLRTLPARTASR
ncbi:S41 family peptidase [Massilia niabensis]|uniref:S41 family peptidase n=1 Tax=Massilia niabensis TaxID=544910 RepID=A0ABW0L4I8_9BURK